MFALHVVQQTHVGQPFGSMDGKMLIGRLLFHPLGIFGGQLPIGPEEGRAGLSRQERGCTMIMTGGVVMPRMPIVIEAMLGVIHHVSPTIVIVVVLIFIIVVLLGLTGCQTSQLVGGRTREEISHPQRYKVEPKTLVLP